MHVHILIGGVCVLQPLDLHVFSIVGKRRQVAGSMIGGIGETQEMIDFCCTPPFLPRIQLALQQTPSSYDVILIVQIMSSLLDTGRIACQPYLTHT